MSGREVRAATSRRERRLGGPLLRGTDAVLLPERETRAGQALAIAFPLIRLDLQQHRREALLGDDGALLDVGVCWPSRLAGSCHNDLYRPKTSLFPVEPNPHPNRSRRRMPSVSAK